MGWHLLERAANRTAGYGCCFLAGTVYQHGIFADFLTVVYVKSFRAFRAVNLKHFLKIGNLQDF